MKTNLKILTSYWFIAGLSLLLLNDFIFKRLFHNWLTGKLSDFAGLFIFPLFWAALFPKYKRHIFVITGLIFIYWKSPYNQPFINIWNETGIWPISRVIDYSDIMALAVLPFAYYIVTNKDELAVLNIRPLVPLLLAAFAFMATSKQKNTFFEEGEAVYHVKSYSRDYLINYLKHSGINVDFTKYNNNKYDDEHCEVHSINDSIATIVVSIGDYNPANNTVKLELSWWSYQHSGNAMLDDEALKVQKKYVKAVFEEKVLKRLPKIEEQ